MARCFVSYTSVDSAWAEWVADVLRQEGHLVTLQATDFLPGDNFVLRMQEAAADADHTVVILSERFLDSKFGAAEWAAAFVQDPTGRERRLIPIAVDDVRPTGLWSAIVRLQIAGMVEDEARQQVIQAVSPAPRIKPAFPTPAPTQPDDKRIAPRVDLWRLPGASLNLVGREAETSALTEAWNSGTENVALVAGWGGAGKTALVSHWVAEMAQNKYHGAEYVFAWSFDGQSDGDERKTSDQFFDAISNFFGLDLAHFANAWERCRRVIEFLQNHRTLLIVDALESLQHPPGPMEGELREPAMQKFFRELAALNAGLLVATSRLNVIDIDSYVGKTCRAINVPELSRDESIAILRHEGVSGSAVQLGSIAQRVRDHPLSLRLLGGYLRTVFDGDARLWEESGLSDAVTNDGGNTAAIMSQYVDWFASRPELQILQMMGLFNRVATGAEFEALCGSPVVEGLNDFLVTMNRPELAYALENLKRSGLLRVENRGEVVDAHPLVREYFRRRFEEVSPLAYQDGHRRLRDLLAQRTRLEPRTLEECAPIMAAIWHATRAGDSVAALKELYPRLSQGRHFLRDSLGAAASNFTVLSYLAEAIGKNSLDAADTAMILADQSLDLRMMGSSSEALRPLASAIELTRGSGNDDRLANYLRHLSQLQLALGLVDEASTSAFDAVRAAEDIRDVSLELLSSKIALACALLHADRIDESLEVLEGGGVLSELVEGTWAHFSDRVTYFIAIYRLGDLLLTLSDEHIESPNERRSLPAMLGDVEQAAGVAISAMDLESSRLADALMRLFRARVSLALDREVEEALLAVDEAVEDFKVVGQRPWIIESLIVRAQVNRTRERSRQASISIDEALELSIADGMSLQYLLARLERLRIGGQNEESNTSLGAIAAEAARSGLMRIERTARSLSLAS